MKIVTDGIVIKEQSIKETDKVVTVLTRDNGIVHAYAAGAKNIKTAKSTATGLLTYSQFVFFKGRDRFVVDDAHAKEVFIGLRADVEKLALAQYFCELAGTVVQENEPAEQQLRLTLNSLFLLCKGTKPAAQIKAAFELRMMAICGFMPNLVCCAECAVYEHEQMSFFPNDGTLLCGDCAGISKARRITTGLGVTAAMRHCVYAEFDKLFAFTVSENALPALAQAAEEYTLAKLERSFTTLDFYKQLKN